MQPDTLAALPVVLLLLGVVAQGLLARALTSKAKGWLAVLLYSASYMAGDKSATRFYVLMQVFIAGLVNLVFTSDLLMLYVSWELVGVCSFLLVGFWYTRDDAAAGARKVLVITHIAGYALRFSRIERPSKTL